jgi:hypothetical protein
MFWNSVFPKSHFSRSHVFSKTPPNHRPTIIVPCVALTLNYWVTLLYHVFGCQHFEVKSTDTSKFIFWFWKVSVLILLNHVLGFEKLQSWFFLIIFFFALNNTSYTDIYVFHVKFVRTNPNFDSKVQAPRLINGIDNQTKLIGTREGSAKWVFLYR